MREEREPVRRIKLVVSDFHIGTGRWRPDGSRNYLEDFFFDEKFVEFLEHHRTGEYHDAEVELIVNGDFFNLLQLSEAAPKGDLFTERVCLDLMERVMDGHEEVFEALHLFALEPRRSVVFVVGNHDPGLLFDGVQAFLREHIGGRVSFHLDAYDFDGVHVEHGNQFDQLNAFDPRKLFLTRRLPEPVVNLPWGSYYLVHVMTREKEHRPHIDKVVPHGRFFRWALVHDTWWSLRVVLRTLAFFVKSVLVPAPHRRFRFRDIGRRLLRYRPSPTLLREAQAMLAKAPHRVVIFGHTHLAMYREYPGERVYVNTGTWNHVTSLDVGNLGRLVRLTYAFLEWDDSRGAWAPHLREWKGYHRVVEELYR